MNFEDVFLILSHIIFKLYENVLIVEHLPIFLQDVYSYNSAFDFVAFGHHICFVCLQ